MLRADLGDFLYIIIFIVLMLAGGVEKYVKAKRQQDNQPVPPQPNDSHDNFPDVEEDRTAPRTLEDMLKRMLQQEEIRDEERNVTIYPEKTQSLENIPAITKTREYQPLVANNMVSKLKENNMYTINQPEENIESDTLDDFEFDIRKAIISSEILNRKYQ